MVGLSFAEFQVLLERSHITLAQNLVSYLLEVTSLVFF